jgi:hypothetical protein
LINSSLNTSILHPLRAMFKRLSLLRVQITLLYAARVAVVHLCLPSRNVCEEHFLDIFERLSGGFREHEESVDSHGSAENAENKIDFPLDIDESGWYEIREGEVKDPESQSQ